MTFDPKHDYEDQNSAKARLNGRLQQPVPCPCHLCRMFELTEGPLLVPAMQTMPDGRKRYTGRWLHGRELKTAIEKRREMFEGMKRALSMYAMEVE